MDEFYLIGGNTMDKRRTISIILFIAGLVIALTSATLLFLGILPSSTSAIIGIVGIGLIDEKKREIVTPAHEMDAPIIEKKNAQVLSINGDIANVMDAETYETFDLKIPEELKNDVKEGKEVLYWVILNEKIMKQVKNG